MTRWFITGATGFIGKNLIEYLRKDPTNAVGIVKHTTLQNPLKLKRALEEFNPHYIIHLAAYGNMAHQKDIKPTFLANVVGTYNLLEQSMHIPYKAFINIGSSSEYGKKKCPMIEEMLPEAEDFYSCTKVAGTYLARAFAKQKCKPIVTIRPFSLYGPGEAEFRFIPQIIKNLYTGELMDIDIDGIHDWIYIDDFIKGLMVVVSQAQQLFGQVVNIGTGIQSSNLEIVNALEDISKRTLKFNYFANMRPSASKVWVDGSNKLRELGWKPKVSLYDGLVKTYDWYTK